MLISTRHQSFWIKFGSSRTRALLEDYHPLANCAPQNQRLCSETHFWVEFESALRDLKAILS